MLFYTLFQRFFLMDRSKIKTYSLKGRQSLVSLADVKPLLSISDPIDSVEFNELVQRIKFAKKEGRPIVWMMGGHVVKVGLSRYIVDLMEKGFITHVATNGSFCIHDFEMAFMGATSEDVLAQLKDGSFGMAEETGRYINEAVNSDAEKGYGAAVGKMVGERNLKFKDLSVSWNCARLKVPYTVHVAIGTDIVHQHPSCDGARQGLATYNDFLKFTDAVCNLDQGVVLNFGCAVIMPEVFLKSLAIARNLGYPTFNVTTANFDQLLHYRPRLNVVERPTAHGGRGFNFKELHQRSIPSLWTALTQ